MAIRSYKNNINQLDFRGQRVTTEDLEFIGAGLENVNFTADGRNVVVTKIYDGSNNLLNIKFEKAAPPTDPQTGEFYIRPDLEVKELGYNAGTFRVEYNFWKFVAGDDGTPGVFIREISPSRSEVRISSIPSSNPDLNLRLEKDFYNFANLVLDVDEYNLLLDDIFTDIDVPVTINKLDIDFLDRLYADFQLNDVSFSNILINILRNSRENMFLRLQERGFVSFNEFIKLFDTTMKEVIIAYFSGDNMVGQPTTVDVPLPENRSNTFSDSLKFFPLQTDDVVDYDRISTEQRRIEKRQDAERRRLELKN